MINNCYQKNNNMKNIKYLFFLLILPVFFFACEDNQIYDGPARVKFEKATNRITIPLKDTIDVVKVQLVSAPLNIPTDVKVTLTGGSAEKGKHFDVTLPEKLTIPAGENIVSFEIKLHYSAFGFMEERTLEFSLEGPDHATAIPVVNKYTLTVVPIATLTYSSIGTGKYQSVAFGGTFDVKYERCDQLPNRYIVVDAFANPFEVIVDPASKTATVKAQDLGEDIFGAGTNTWIQCTAGKYSPGVITFDGGTWDNAYWTSEGMSSGYRLVEEIFILPDGGY